MMIVIVVELIDRVRKGNREGGRVRGREDEREGCRVGG